MLEPTRHRVTIEVDEATKLQLDTYLSRGELRAILLPIVKDIALLSSTPEGHYKLNQISTTLKSLKELLNGSAS